MPNQFSLTMLFHLNIPPHLLDILKAFTIQYIILHKKIFLIVECFAQKCNFVSEGAAAMPTQLSLSAMLVFL